MSPSSKTTPHPLAKRLIFRLCGPENTAKRHDIWVLEIGTGNGRNAHALEAAGISYVSIVDSEDATVVPDLIRNATASVQTSLHVGDTRTFAASLQTIQRRFDATLTTHGLLHGHPNDIHEIVTAIVEKLEPDGLFYATFGSSNDARFGHGEKLGPHTYAPTDGSERGIPHSYFTETELRALLEPYFTIERIEETRVDSIIGDWAHSARPLTNAMHWFIEAIRQ